MTYDPVLLPLIRSVMPNIIAQSIIGAQPTYGGWHGSLVMHKHHFQHFLRVYNRRKNHSGLYLSGLGYQKVNVEFSKVLYARNWCKDTLKHGSYLISINDFWFAYDRDATLFMMRWS